MKSILIAVMALATVGACAQTAKVIALSDGDAAQIKSLYQQRTELDKKIANAEVNIRIQYTTVRDDNPDASGTLALDASGLPWGATITGVTWLSTTGCVVGLSDTTQKQRDDYNDCMKRQKEAPKEHYHTYRRGWESGINYTADFKFIVPQEKPSFTTSSPWPCATFGPVAY